MVDITGPAGVPAYCPRGGCGAPLVRIADPLRYDCTGCQVTWSEEMLLEAAAGRMPNLPPVGDEVTVGIQDGASCPTCRSDHRAIVYAGQAPDTVGGCPDPWHVLAGTAAGELPVRCPACLGPVVPDGSGDARCDRCRLGFSATPSPAPTLRSLPALEEVELAVLLVAVDKMAVAAGLPATPFLDELLARLPEGELAGVRARTLISSLRTAILEALS